MKFIYADTETIGLNTPDAPASGICQIAVADINPDTLESGPIVTSLVNPGAPIHPEASKVHGIFDHDVANAPTIESVFAPKEPVFVIAHNAPFDLRFMSRHIEVLAGSLCTLQLARRLLPNAPNHKLTTLVDFLGLEHGKAHDAGGDVFMGIQLLKHLLGLQAPRTMREICLAEAKPKMLSVMPFGKYKGKAFADMPAGYLEWLIGAEGTHPDTVYTAKRILAFKKV